MVDNAVNVVDDAIDTHDFSATNAIVTRVLLQGWGNVLFHGRMNQEARIEVQII